MSAAKPRVYNLQARVRKLRGAIWRTVRDAGAVGISGPELVKQVALIEARTPKSTYYQINALADEGYIARRFVAGVWVVDGDCRVPAGESAHLGPGWTGKDADLVGAQQQEAA